MDKISSIVPLAKRTMRELRIIYALVATQVKRTSQQIHTICAENERNGHEDVPIRVRTEAAFSEDTIVRERQRDQDPQQRTQNSIKHAAWATFAAVILYAGVTALQWQEMRKSTDTAARELELSERPWVSVESAISGPLIFDRLALLNEKDTSPAAPIVKVPMTFTLTNLGHSPAERTLLDVEMLLTNTGNDFYRLQRLQKDISSDFRRNPMHIGDIIFPGNPFYSHVTVDVSLLSFMFECAGKSPRLNPAKAMDADIVGCVTYQSQFMLNVYHHTCFVLHLSRRNEVVPEISVAGVEPQFT